MPKCNKCNEEICFKPHPQNQDKIVPFNLDGEIHFATCGKNDRYKLKHQGVFNRIKIGNSGDGRRMKTFITIDSPDLEVRVQNIIGKQRVFIEIEGECEWQDFVDAINEYSKG